MVDRIISPVRCERNERETDNSVYVNGSPWATACVSVAPLLNTVCDLDRSIYIPYIVWSELPREIHGASCV